MFTSVASRSASAYQRVSLDTSVNTASPHQLINLLFEGLLNSLGMAQAAMSRGDVATKGEQIGKAVRILEEGLIVGLDPQKGGDLAANLKDLYDYSVLRLTHANLKNDTAALAEVVRVIEPLAQGWRQMGSDQVATRTLM